MTLNVSEVDIKNVTIVSILREFFLVKAYLQCHNSNYRHNVLSVTDTAEAVRDDNAADCFSCCKIYLHIRQETFCSRVV